MPAFQCSPRLRARDRGNDPRQRWSDPIGPKIRVAWSSAAKSTRRLLSPPAALLPRRRELSRPALLRRESLGFFSVLVELVRRPWPVENLLQLVERIGANCTTLAANHHEPKWPVENRQLRFADRACELLGKSKARDAGPLAVYLLDVVIDVDFPITDVHCRGKCGEALADFCRNEVLASQAEARISEIIHGLDRLELLLIPRGEVAESKARRSTAGSPKGVANSFYCRPVSLHRGVTRITARHRLRKCTPRAARVLRGKILQRLGIALELESEILQSARQHELSTLSLRIVSDLGNTSRCVAVNQVHGDLRAFDCRARRARAVREVPDLTGDGAPAAAHTRSRHSRIHSVGSFLVDDEVERHEARKKLCEFSVHVVTRENHLLGEWHPERAKHTRHPESS